MKARQWRELGCIAQRWCGLPAPEWVSHAHGVSCPGKGRARQGGGSPSRAAPALSVFLGLQAKQASKASERARGGGRHAGAVRRGRGQAGSKPAGRPYVASAEVSRAPGAAATAAPACTHSAWATLAFCTSCAGLAAGPAAAMQQQSLAREGSGWCALAPHSGLAVTGMPP